MPENIVRSRTEALEETVQNLSQKVETLLRENMILYEKSKKADEWIVMLRDCCKGMVQRTAVLEERCSTLRRSVDLHGLQLNAFSTITSEEKSLNSDSFLSELLQIQAPHIEVLPDPPQEVRGAYNENAQLEPRIYDLKGKAQGIDQRNGLPTPPSGECATLHRGYLSFPEEVGNRGGPSTRVGGKEPVAPILTSRKPKAQEIEEGLGTASASSNSYSGPITFNNTFSEDFPI